jgi:hypothetical protein
MRGLVIVSRDDHGVAHDGSAGVSPEGWLPDRVSVGALTRAFPPEVVDRVVATTDSREIRRRLLPARLVVYVRHEALRCIPGSAGRNSEGCSWV